MQDSSPILRLLRSHGCKGRIIFSLDRRGDVQSRGPQRSPDLQGQARQHSLTFSSSLSRLMLVLGDLSLFLERA